VSAEKPQLPEPVIIGYASIEDCDGYRSTLDLADGVMGMVNDLLAAKGVPLRLRITPRQQGGAFEVNWFEEG